MDGFNGKIVSYKIADNQEVPLVKDALSEAIISIKYKNLILHSDQGAVYTYPNFQNFVKQNGITMSMFRKGNTPSARPPCWAVRTAWPVPLRS